MPDLTFPAEWSELNSFIDRRIGLISREGRERYAFVVRMVSYDGATERWSVSSYAGATFFQEDGWRIVSPQSLHL